ncbi:hypothetical protein CK507_13450 [Pseudomonas sp. WN033]|nr:hypothetical protein CK507_13450 [Pseudomonas sp. WN033]
MPRILPLTALPLLLALPLAAAAQIYTWTDADGNKVFSDQPGPGASTVEVGPTNTVEPPRRTEIRSPDTSNQPAADPAYQRLEITSPSNDEAIRSNEGNLVLSVTTDPGLSGSHLLRVELDGELTDVSSPGRGQRNHLLSLTNIDRGSHQLAVVVVDARGNVVQRSNAITVHLQRTSLLQPGRAGGNQAPQAPNAPRAPNVPAPGRSGGS